VPAIICPLNLAGDAHHLRSGADDLPGYRQQQVSAQREYGPASRLNDIYSLGYNLLFFLFRLSSSRTFILR
jgi:hypothetical protein